MTVLGQHTIAETEDLMKTVEFRIQAGNKTNAQITMPQIAANQALYMDLQKDWNNFQVRWATARDPVLNSLLVKNVGQPLVPVSLIVSEPEYQAIKKAINVGGQDTYVKGDLTDVLNRIEQFSGQTINEKDHPMPSGFDPDLAAYKKVDASIKAGEAAALAATNAAGAVSFMMPWWVYAGGAAAALAVGYVYVRPFLPAPRPIERKENLTK